MTGSGMYGGDDVLMLNIELARILQVEREREIEVELRARRLLGSTARKSAADGSARLDRAIRREPIRPDQRPASSGAGSR